jgi:arsenate reductase-like glutaredoxin family protein
MLQEQKIQKFIFRPSDIQEFLERKVNSLIEDEILNGFVIVEGILGKITDNKYSVYYGIPLTDVLGGSISVNIPKTIAEKGFAGKEVQVFGSLKPKVWAGKAEVILNATKIELKKAISKEILERDKTISEFLTSYKKLSHDFPNKEFINISVLHGISSQVKNDFERQLLGLEKIKINYIPINIIDIESIKNGIDSLTCDIAVIIRGGGSNGEFEVFNNMKLVETWAEKDFYKITALGHTENRTYIDLFSDMSCDTPTAAGNFIKQKITTYTILEDYKKLSEKHKEDLKKIVSEKDKKIEDMRKQKDEEIKSLNEKMLTLQKEMQVSFEKLKEQYALKEFSLISSVKHYRLATIVLGLILLIWLLFSHGA